MLLAAFAGEIRPVASTALLLQYEDVLTRPETLSAAGASRADANDLLDDFCAICLPAATDAAWRPLSPDVGDDLALEAAVNGMAVAIATFDLRHLRGPAARFGIAVERPADVLGWLA